MISSIVHIIHEYDNDSVPWPLHIEDHHGKMHEVSLEEGQVHSSGKSNIVIYPVPHTWM